MTVISNSNILQGLTLRKLQCNSEIPIYIQNFVIELMNDLVLGRYRLQFQSGKNYYI